MPQLALAVVGAEIGAAVLGSGVVFAGLTGSAIGMAAGSLIGGVLFAPTVKSQGPRLSDLKATQVSYGATIPYVEGHQRVPGVIVWASDKREISTTTSQGGKGGGGAQVTTFTYECDILFLLAENELPGLRRVWKNGEVIWTPATTETDSWTRLTFYSGAADQMPDPTYEAAVGTANAPAYRSRASVFIEGLQLGSSGQLPALTFEVGASAVSERDGTVLSLWNFDTAGVAISLHSSDYPAGSNPGLYSAPLADQSELATPNHWVIAGHNHDEPSIDPGIGLSFAPYQTAASFSCSTFFCETAWTLSGDFTIEFRMSPEGHSWASSDTLRYMVSCIQVLGTETDGDWQIVHTGVTSGAGVQFGMRIAGATYSVSSAVNIDLSATSEITVQRQGSALYVHLDGELVGTATGVSTADIGGVGTVTICGRQDGGYLTPNDFATGTYQAFRVTTGLARYGSGSFTPGQTWTLDARAVNVDVYGSEPTLQEVVERQCSRGGVPLEYVDASALAGINVHGMVLSQITSPRAVIEMLAQAYFFTRVESDVLRFQLRGADSVADIPYDELVVAQDDDALPIVKANDLELPVQVFVKYSNVLDDYQDGNESSDRLVSTGQNTTQVEFPLALTPIEAKRIADMQVTDAAASCLRFGPFSQTRDYAALEPTDVVTLHDAAGNTFRARLTQKTEAGGVLTFQAVSDDAQVVASAAVTTSSGYTFSTLVRAPVATQAQLLDMPVLRDEDDDAGFYAVVRPASAVTSFPGAVLFKSVDDVTFEASVSFAAAGVFGTATTTLGAGALGVFDEVNSVTVDVGTGELSSVTRDALLGGTANAMLIGAEVIRFRTATLVSAGVYTLAGLLRGQRGTEWAVGTHGAAEAAVLLDTSLRRVPMSNAELGLPRHWKPVTAGRSTATADSQAFTDTGIGKKPFSPVALRIARDSSGNATLTWLRRTRHSCRFVGPMGISTPLGEESELYDVEIWNSTYSVLKRTFSGLAAPTAAYTSAQQVSDFGGNQSTIYARVYQRSASVGRGYVLQANG